MGVHAYIRIGWKDARQHSKDPQWHLWGPAQWWKEQIPGIEQAEYERYDCKHSLKGRKHYWMLPMKFPIQ